MMQLFTNDAIRLRSERKWIWIKMQELEKKIVVAVISQVTRKANSRLKV